MGIVVCHTTYLKSWLLVRQRPREGGIAIVEQPNRANAAGGVEEGLETAKTGLKNISELGPSVGVSIGLGVDNGVTNTYYSLRIELVSKTNARTEFLLVGSPDNRNFAEEISPGAARHPPLVAR